ncbi:MAG TPA: hypothetical protein DCS93_24430 [Microscillaceae bacterium]|nr:hypothetical protein [Microscillaceae bacterium]
MNTFQEKLRRWSFFRQGLDRSGTNIEQALKKVMAVYSAHPSGPLSLWARVQSFDNQGFQALDHQQLAVRMPAMRLSVHQIPVANAPYVFAATVPPKSGDYWQKRYAQRGLPNEDFVVWRTEILALTNTPQTVKELKKEISFPEDKLKFVLNRMAFEGDLLRVGSNSLRANTISYVKTTAWLTNWSEDYLQSVTQEEALDWLAKAYFKAFGPATVKDFQWWAGITATKAKQAITHLDLVNLEEQYYILAEDFTDFEKFNLEIPENQLVTILPQWDAYLMGYAPEGRARVVETQDLPQVYGKLGATGGNALGTILINGKTAGIWKHKFKGIQVQFEKSMFDKTEGKIEKQIDTQLHEIGRLMEAKKIEIS